MPIKQQQWPTKPPAASFIQRVSFPEASPEQTRDANQTPLVAVVVTIHDSGSFDPLFREYKQTPPDGRVSVWECSSAALGPLLKELQGEPSGQLHNGNNKLLGELKGEIAEVDASSVVFNWECCAGCTDAGFLDTALVMRLAAALLDRGYTLMFSDFSLKALISAWSRAGAHPTLGRCPMVKLGEFSTRFELRFDPVALRGCGSAQLERVGELCETGEASVQALSGTIAYSVDPTALPGAPYRACVLTVATSFDGAPAFTRFPTALRSGFVCSVGQHRGAAGHLRLSFASGGALLLSCGHWVELARLDVTAERLVQVAQQTYGVEKTALMEQEMAAADPAERAILIQQYAKQIVATSTPGSYTKK